MISVSIGEELKARCPQAALGCMQCKVKTAPSDEALLEKIHAKIEELAQIELSQENKREKIQATRKGYKALGKDPNRYRNSAEAMSRRISKERGLYYINNVVDANNLLSITSGYSMGTYDVKGIVGDVTWERAPEGTAYQGIGKDVLNLEYLPVLFDAEGAFGNPTSDSTRTMVQDGCEEVLLVYYAFDGAADLPALLEEAKTLFAAHCGGSDFEIKILAD